MVGNEEIYLPYCSGQKYPLCGSEVIFEDGLMFMAQLNCSNSDCDFHQDDW